MDARGITLAFGGRWAGSYGLARCPSHEDRTPSLKVSDDPRKSDNVDVHCFAGCDWKTIKTELSRLGLLDIGSQGWPHTGEVTPPGVIVPDEENDGLRRAANIWRASVPPNGTLAEVYLRQHRKLDIPKLGDLDHVLRFQPDLQSMVGLMSYPALRVACGVHRTFLNADGSSA
jgi:putative DNA primase/helicase